MKVLESILESKIVPRIHKIMLLRLYMLLKKILTGKLVMTNITGMMRCYMLAEIALVRKL